MTRMRPGAAVSAAGAVIAVVVGMASPANAAVPPAINVDSPAGNAVLTDQPIISGSVTMPGSLDAIGNVAVSLTSAVASDLPAPCDPCNSEHGQTASFSWSPGLARNGPYQAHISAGGSQFLLGVLDGEQTSEGSVSFRVEIPPASPAGVRAEASADQTIRVTWARNGEPDMIAYRVQRKDAGASTFHDVGGAVPQPSSGSAVSIADPGATPGGGKLFYQVQAIRAGRSGDASTAVGSDFSATEVVLPPVASPAGPPGAPPAGPPQNAAPTPNLSAFLKGSGGLPKASVPEAPSIPDGTFSENLPFALPPAGAGRAGADGIGLPADSSGNSARAVLVPVAGGLLLCLVAFHVRRFNHLLAPAAATPTTDRRKAKVDRHQETQSLPVVATTDDDRPPVAEAAATPAPTPAAAPSWLLGIGIKRGDNPPVRPVPSELPERPSTRKAPVSLDYWSTARRAPSDPEPPPDESGDDDAKWAPLTSTPFPTNVLKGRSQDRSTGDPWEDVLVEPGVGKRAGG